MTSRSNPKIAVIGSKSMVGSRFIELLQTQIDFVKSDLNSDVKMDITDENLVTEFFENYEFESVILFSAFTDVDAAEAQRNEKGGSCWKINVEGPKNIANLCKTFGKKLIFISTDFVFDGLNGPYDEDAEPGGQMELVSWYGITKLEAEKYIAENILNATIIRIAYPYRAAFAGKDDLLKRTLRLYRQGELYPMFSDQQISPTFIDDLAIAIPMILKIGKDPIYHIASPVPTTPYDLARKLITTFGGNADDVEEGNLKEFLSQSKKTPRPVKGGLNTIKIQNLGFTPTNWDQGIDKIAAQSEGKLI